MACSIVHCTPPRVPERCQTGPQEGTEQVVIAVPPAFVVEGHDEEIGRDQPIEEDRSIVASAHLGAQLSVEGFQHGGVDEKIDQLRLEVVEYLAQQEVADGSIGPREGLQELASVRTALQRERRQLCAGGPTFGQIVENLDLTSLERQALQSRELRCLRSSEPEIVAA